MVILVWEGFTLLKSCWRPYWHAQVQTLLSRTVLGESLWLIPSPGPSPPDGVTSHIVMALNVVSHSGFSMFQAFIIFSLGSISFVITKSHSLTLSLLRTQGPWFPLPWCQKINPPVLLLIFQSGIDCPHAHSLWGGPRGCRRDAECLALTSWLLFIKSPMNWGCHLWFPFCTQASTQAAVAVDLYKRFTIFSLGCIFSYIII